MYGDKIRKKIRFVEAVYFERYTEILSRKFKDGRDRLFNFSVSSSLIAVTKLYVRGNILSTPCS